MVCHSRCYNQTMMRRVSVNDEFRTTSFDVLRSDIARRVLLKIATIVFSIELKRQR